MRIAATRSDGSDLCCRLAPCLKRGKRATNNSEGGVARLSPRLSYPFCAIITGGLPLYLVCGSLAIPGYYKARTVTYDALPGPGPGPGPGPAPAPGPDPGPGPRRP